MRIFRSHKVQNSSVKEPDFWSRLCHNLFFGFEFQSYWCQITVKELPHADEWLFKTVFVHHVVVLGSDSGELKLFSLGVDNKKYCVENIHKVCGDSGAKHCASNCDSCELSTHFWQHEHSVLFVQQCIYTLNTAHLMMCHSRTLAVQEGDIIVNSKPI